MVIPAGFEADIRAGQTPNLQFNIDATKTIVAAVGTGYLTVTFNEEINRFVTGQNIALASPVDLVLRQSFNPEGNAVWLKSIAARLNQLSILAIVLTGLSLIREREHGTIEYLMVMPLTAVEIAMSKIIANSLMIFVAFVFALFIMVEGVMNVPFAGREGLLLAGTAVYLFAAASIGVLLGILARSMAQFALLLILVLTPIMIL